MTAETVDTVFLIGADVYASDGRVGEVAGLVVDPDAGTLASLAVEPAHRQHREPDRLVPLEMVARCAGDVSLSCEISEFGGLPAVEEARPARVHGRLGPPRPPILAAARAMGLGMVGGDGPDDAASDPRDVIPCGDDEVCAGQHVHAADGDGGHFRGLAVGAGGRITGLLVDVGHPPIRRRIEVPIEAVAALGSSIRVSLTREQLRILAERPELAGRRSQQSS